MRPSALIVRNVQLQSPNNRRQAPGWLARGMGVGRWVSRSPFRQILELTRETRCSQLRFPLLARGFFLSVGQRNPQLNPRRKLQSNSRRVKSILVRLCPG